MIFGCVAAMNSSPCSWLKRAAGIGARRAEAEAFSSQLVPRVTVVVISKSNQLSIILNNHSQQFSNQYQSKSTNQLSTSYQPVNVYDWGIRIFPDSRTRLPTTMVIHHLEPSQLPWFTHSGTIQPPLVSTSRMALTIKTNLGPLKVAAPRGKGWQCWLVSWLDVRWLVAWLVARFIGR